MEKRLPMFRIKLLRYTLYILPIFSCALIYTYCVPAFRPPVTSQLASEAEDEDKLEDEEEDDEEIDEEEVDPTLMPYDIRLDTMALLTCDSSSIPGGNSNFRAGTFLKEFYEGGGGIKLRTPFLKMDKEQVREYPYHKTSPALFFGSAAGGFLKNKSSILSSIQLKNYLDELSDGYIHKFGSKFIDFRIAVRNITFDNLFAEPVLATFIEKGERQPALYIDQSDDPEIHGRSYQVSLEEQEYFPTLEEVEERYPLLKTDYEWSCGPNVFKVHRHERHRYETESDADPLREPGCDEDDKSNPALYQLARKILGEDWYIDTENNCISPKKGSRYCYRSRPERVDFSEDCSGRNQGYHCPHYFSICTVTELEE